MFHARVSRGFALLTLLANGAPVPGQTPAVPPTRSAPVVTSTPTATTRTPAPVTAGETILRALRANPATSPYRVGVRFKGSQAVLFGRVGSKLAHDEALRTVMGLGYAVGDDLTIDTNEGRRVALAAPFDPTLAVGRVLPPLPYAFAFDAPLVTYPPWWGAVRAREPLNLAALAQGVPLTVPSTTTTDPAAPQEGEVSRAVNLTLDELGVATLRGTVGSIAERMAVEREVGQVPGVTAVENWLEVTGQGPAVANGPIADRDTPPPPPQPAYVPSPAPRVEPQGVPPRRPKVDPQALPRASGGVAARVEEAWKKRPALANLPLSVTVKDGVATLTGDLPGALEAMLAYRATEQTPGVREVLDRLTFPQPEPDRPNPLLAKGRPEDVEPYLLAQVRRQIGDLAHVDQIRLRGDALELTGTVTRDDDRPRLEAALRSIPLLRGFRLEPNFLAD